MINQNELRQIFPQTLASLQEQNLDSVLGEFSRFCLNDLNHSSNVTGWFPVFLKAQGHSAELTEICQYEWLKFSCVALDWGKPRLDLGQVALAPGVQFINLERAAQSLSHQAGPVVIYNRDGQAQARSLTAAEALCLDAVGEDRKFSQPQLVEYLQMEAGAVGLHSADWGSLVARLIEERLLIVECRVSG